MNKNFILSLHPFTKLTFSFFVTISVFIIPSYWYAYLTLPLCLLIAIFAKRAKSFLVIVGITLPFILVIIFFFQALFYQGTTVVWEKWILTVTQEGIQYGLTLTSRMLAFGTAFILFFRITEVKEFIKALEDVGLPPMGSYVVLSTLQIIPEMRKQASIIMDAQKTRGVEMEGNLWIRTKAFFPTFTPLILSSIASTEERAITLESRGFLIKGKKTSLFKLQKRRIDKGIQLLFLILLISLIVWRVFQ